MSDSGEPPATIRVFVLDEACAPLRDLRLSQFAAGHECMRRSEQHTGGPQQIAECHPQLLVTTLGLGAADSLKLIRTLRAENPMLRVLVYSAFRRNRLRFRGSGSARVF